MSRLPVVTKLMEAQEAAGLSSGAVARATGLRPSSISRYRSGEAEPSLHVADAWARACDAELAVLRRTVAATHELAQAAEDLTPSELAQARDVIEALRTTRQDPARRAVVLAAVGLAAGQIEHLTGRARLA